MKIQVDGKEVFELNETKMKCIKNDIPSSIFTKDMERRVCYVVEHKYEQGLKRLKDEWEPKLKGLGVKSIPLDNDEFSELVFSQASYKDRETRELESI